jgi:hypothetical protein
MTVEIGSAIYQHDHLRFEAVLTLVNNGLTPVKKLSKAEQLVAEQMLAIVEWASERPDRWHPVGRLDATKKAAELLVKRGVIEVWTETGLYRVKPQK